MEEGKREGGGRDGESESKGKQKGKRDITYCPV